MAIDGSLDTVQAEAVFRQIASRVAEGGLYQGALTEMAIIAVSIACAMAASWLVNRWTQTHRCELQHGDGIRRRLWAFLLEIPSRLALPVTASAMVLLVSAAGAAMGQTPPLQDMPLCRLAQTLYGALASARLICYCVKRLFGEKFFLSERLVSWCVWGLFLLQLVGVLPRVVQTMKQVVIPLGSGNASLWSFSIGLLTVALTIGVAHWLLDLFRVWLSDFRAAGVDGNLKIVIQRVVTIALYGAAVVTALSAAGLDMTVLSVFGGALGVGLGFGLQKIASNYVSGFIVLLERSVKIGDLVDVGGIRGTVSKMATRYTVIRTLDGTENVVPNELLVTSPVANLSYTNRLTRLTVDASVAYGSNYARALDIMEDCARAQSRVVDNPPVKANVTEMADSAVNLQVSMWISDAEKGTQSLRSDILRAILMRFDEEGLEIPFPQLDVTIKNPPAGQA